MEFSVTAKRYGDSVKFEVTAKDVKEALKEAKSEASVIFDCQPGEDVPTVAVKPIAEEE